MRPQIEFRHVLSELSVNRNDPCEVLRELISNSYDADAKNLFYAPLKSEKGFIFFDDGTGLDTEKKTNGVTPYEAFFSIGKSTKKKGEAIGYKCQGSKLCFACARILIATKFGKKNTEWHFKSVENPRKNLDISTNITPETSENLEKIISNFLPETSADTQLAIDSLIKFIKEKNCQTGTLIIIDGLDTENFSKYFQFGRKIEESYVYNYVRLYTKHGDTRALNKDQGFSSTQITQTSDGFKKSELIFYGNKKTHNIPFGFPYLKSKETDAEVKTPSQVSRLRDGRFFSRAAKRFQISGTYYTVIMALDGNRRAHEDYPNLDRKGKTKSGIRLGDQRGLFISVNGIKICRYMDIFSSLEGYEILAEGESPSHYTLILDGDFDLVTNRNSLSKKAFDALSDPDLLKEIKKFLDHLKKTDKVFQELLSRLKKESTENKLNEQIEILDTSKEDLKSREKFRIKDQSKNNLIFVSPQPGEEYLVGVLYSSLYNLIDPSNEHYDKWKRVITFSTQGIDSLGIKDTSTTHPLASENIVSIEYKYNFNNYGPFNHALAIVDYIVAWEVDIEEEQIVQDTFTCSGRIKQSDNTDFEWEIYEIESNDGAQYPKEVKVICLKKLIEKTFNTKFR
ncbi:ATP-binding protein [Pseudomonas aeruginosa]|uniref:ATP-binding protein n=1 Tax=Pseudomonas aeruginosa TaxID=287 RepID=UPI0009371B9F|nr:ATP-binding protein [Pseudomonas aeruginosa]MCV0035289.1 ATP-binding protein [Pseudomonas aeruginosa]MDA3401481.1 ATP-binding protein [Pseudomonas aeruginosa]MDT8136513.1 ATP-binding protein [Pseudomonas aeruginosa]MDY1118703.1 ATP-binding protein [Pseudomonas aeruginosa]NQD30936.1 hypothetical protein [Pseudomonas aeruginosa]